MRSRAATNRLHLNARLVREKDRVRARELRWLLLGCAAIALTLLSYVWQRVDFIRLSYEVEELKTEVQEQRELNEALRVERSLQAAPARVENLARRRLGLIDPAPQDVRRVVIIDGTIDELGGPVARAGQRRPALAAIGRFAPVGDDGESLP